MPTISFHNDTNKTSIAHNNRTNINGNKNIDIDKIKDNITYVKRDIREVYAEEFDDVVAEYNDKQKRSDRKIDNYYKKVLHDKKTEHQRELIVAVGKAEENTDEKMIEMKKEILDQYAREFQKRNPNLRVYNCVMHLDEKNPHLHINYVPVASYSKGLKKRVAFTKALDQQGLKFEKWREIETSFIEELMNERGLEREYEGSHKYLSVKEYKELKDLIADKKQEYEYYVKNSNSIKEEVEEIKEEMEELKTDLENILNYDKINKKDMKYVHFTYSENEHIKKGTVYQYEDADELIKIVNDIKLDENAENKNNKNFDKIKLNVCKDRDCDDVIIKTKVFIGAEKFINLYDHIRSNIADIIQDMIIEKYREKIEKIEKNVSNVIKKSKDTLSL